MRAFDNSEFEKYKDEVKEKWGYKARPTSELKHWLSGIVRCSSCGATLIFAAPHYFKCNNYVRGRCKHSQHIKADLLAEALIKKMNEDASQPFLLDVNITYTHQNGGSDISRLEAALKMLQSKKARLQDAYLSGVLDLNDFAAAKKDLDANIAQVEQDLHNLHSKTDEAAVKAAIKAVVSKVLATLTDPMATTEQKHNAARSVIENCTFDKQTQTLNITYGIVF